MQGCYWSLSSKVGYRSIEHGLQFRRNLKLDRELAATFATNNRTRHGRPLAPFAIVSISRLRGYDSLFSRLLGCSIALPMAAMAADKPEAPTERLGVPSRNPLPLSASQESQVRDIYYARVRKNCTEEIKGLSSPARSRSRHPADQDTAFAACALGRTFTVSFACRAEHRAMNGCMTRHATQAEHDAAREEWFAMRIERQRQRERKQKMAQAQEEFMRDWWGLPEDVRLSRQKEMEKKGERIGGMPAQERPHKEEEVKRWGT